MTQVKLGDKNIPFIYQGNNLLYPNPVKDGLVLWYDFKGIKNSDYNKEIAEDLSGNKNFGKLENFGYTSASGYNDGLKFDNVDDYVSLDIPMRTAFTISMTLEINLDTPIQFFCRATYAMFYIRKNYGDLQASILLEGNKQVTTPTGNGFFDNLRKSGRTKFQVSITADNVTKKLKLYGDGEFISERVFDLDLSPNNLTKLGQWSGASNLDGKILSVQMYDRILTNKEIQHNYKLDKERWGL